MKKQLSDDQLDNLMRTLLGDASPGEAEVNDIADSPTLWWGVQRNINAGKQTQKSPWPPIAKLWRRGWINIPTFAALAAAVLIISFFALRPATTPDRLAEIAAPLDSPVDVVTSESGPAIAATTPTQSETGMAPLKQDRRHIAVTKAVSRHRAPSGPSTPGVVAKKATEMTEIKTDFIALSYARNAESGQIVRVKVPSSMMVTLGLVSAVEKPSALIDAEIVVGDDGLSRAIRFIR